MFVHLTPERHAARIRRTGIRATSFGADGQRGVFAVPMLPSYVITHQWLRELRRRGQRLFVAVDFRVPDDLTVLTGHYAEPGVPMTAAEAVALIRSADDPRGYEVVVRRGISPREIHRIRSVNQVTGWRYRPDAHGERPCACPICLGPGEYKANDIRTRFGET